MQSRPGGRILAMLPNAMAQLTVGADGSAQGRFHRFPFAFVRMQGHRLPRPPDAELLALVEQVVSCRAEVHRGASSSRSRIRGGSGWTRDADDCRGVDEV